MRKAELLSTTAAPFSTASGPISRLTPLPAQINTRSTSPRSSGVASSTVRSSPKDVSFLPQDRSDAHRRTPVAGKVPLFEYGEKDRAYRPGRTDHRDSTAAHCSSHPTQHRNDTANTLPIPALQRRDVPSAGHIAIPALASKTNQISGQALPAVQ